MSDLVALVSALAAVVSAIGAFVAAHWVRKSAEEAAKSAKRASDEALDVARKNVAYQNFVEFHRLGVTINASIANHYENEADFYQYSWFVSYGVAMAQSMIEAHPGDDKVWAAMKYQLSYYKVILDRWEPDDIAAYGSHIPKLLDEVKKNPPRELSFKPGWNKK